MIQTEINLTKESPSEKRDSRVEQIPDAAFEVPSINVQLKLSLQDGTQLGYMGVNDNGWCVIDGSPSTFSKQIANGKTYYQLIDNDTKFNKRWINAQRHSTNKPVGIYRKYLRSAWTYENNRFIWDVNSMPLSFKDQAKGFLYANDGEKFTVLKVEEVSA